MIMFSDAFPTFFVGTTSLLKPVPAASNTLQKVENFK